MDHVTFIGTFGAFLILFAFIMGQLHIWKDDYFIYDFINFLGAVFLIIYAVLLNSWPFGILNTVWALVSLRDMFIDINRNKKRCFTRGFYKKWME